MLPTPKLRPNQRQENTLMPENTTMSVRQPHQVGQRPLQSDKTENPTCVLQHPDRSRSPPHLDRLKTYRLEALKTDLTKLSDLLLGESHPLTLPRLAEHKDGLRCVLAVQRRQRHLQSNLVGKPYFLGNLQHLGGKVDDFFPFSDLSHV